MPTGTSAFKTAANSNLGRSNNWLNPSLALLQSDANAEIDDPDSDPPGGPYPVWASERLQLTELADPPPPGAYGLTEIRLNVYKRSVLVSGGPQTDEIIDAEAYLIVDGAVASGVNKADAVTGWSSANIAVATVYTFTSANLATLGVDIGHLTGPFFGFAFAAEKDGTVDRLDADIDLIDIEYDYTGILDINLWGGNNDMDIMRAVLDGGLKVIEEQALSNVTASAASLNPPDGTRCAMISVAGHNLHVNFMGATCTTADTAIIAGAQPMWLPYGKEQLDRFTFIEAGTNMTAKVVYFGNK